MPKQHGHRRGGTRSQGRTPTYISWDSMIARCCRPSHPYYASYGGDGIRVCEQWRGRGGFARFLEDVGERPEGKTLDRIDPWGDYRPGNVRWATPKEQTWNRRMMRERIEENRAVAALVEREPEPEAEYVF